MEQSQFIKGSLSAIILKLLEDNDRMYGYEMTKAVKEMTGDKVNITEAALYPALHRLLEAGMLETEVEQVAGRMRKYYSLSKKGKKESSLQINSLLEALSSVQLLLNKNSAMDSKVLSKEQLKQLVKFIHSRGFKEPVVVLEILDHFACKVEESLSKDATIPFDTAMKKAHESFGVMGFHPIAGSFVQQTKAKYKKLFWRNFKQEVFRPVSLVALPLFGLSIYKLHIITSSYLKFRIWDTWNIVDIVFFILLILCPLLDLSIMFRLPKEDRKHPFITSSLMNGSVSGLTLNIILSSILRERNEEHPAILGVILAVYIMYIIPRYIATRKTIAKAKDDLEAVKQMAIE